jgi:hypothetical protein
MKSYQTRLDFNHIVIIESLPNDEPKTGTDLHHFLSTMPSVRKLKINLLLCSVQSATEFHDLMRNLIEATKYRDLLPMIHVECHGSEDGLHFADGSDMSYLRASRLLLQLNRATNLNLVASFAACFGAYFLRQMDLMRRCPVRVMVAPSEDVQASELFSGFAAFYRTVLETLKISDAQSTLEARQLNQGMWIVETAEAWYLRVAANHLLAQCSKAALRHRAQRVHARKTLLVGSAGWSERETYERLTRDTRTLLLDRYYRRFFMVNAIPTNAERFKRVNIELQSLMLKLRRKGTHKV